MRSRASLMAAFTLVCLLTGCGDDGKAPGGARPTVKVSGAVFDLLPEGTVGVVYVHDLKSLEGKVRGVAGSVNPAASAQVSFSEFVGSIPGFDPMDMDWSRPAAFAVTIAPNAREPEGTAILPVRDENASRAKVTKFREQTGVDTAPGYLAISPRGAPKRAGLPARLAGPMPAGDIVARFDIAALVKAFGPEIMKDLEREFGRGRRGAETSPAKPMVDGFKSILESVSLCDIAVDAEGTVTKADATLHFVDGKSAALLGMFKKSNLAALARGLPDGGSLSLAMSVDFERLWAAMSPMVDASLAAFPPEQRAALQKSMGTAADMMKSIGPGMAFDMKFGPSGIAGVGVASSSGGFDYDGFLARSVETMKGAGSFVAVHGPEKRVVDGVSVSTLRMTFDPSKMPETGHGGPDTASIFDMVYGREGMRYSIATLGDRMLTVLGGDAEVDAAIKAAKVGAPGALSHALAAAGSDTVGYLRLDLAAVLRDVLPVMGRSGFRMGMPPEDPVVITATLNAGDDALRVRLSYDVGAFGKMLRRMSERPR